MPSLSNVRWYNDHEIAVFLWERFDQFIRFIRHGLARIPNDGFDDADYVKELRALERTLYGLAVLAEPQASILKLELLAFVEYGRPLAAACYFLEGDYPTLPYVRHYINVGTTALSDGTYPHVSIRKMLILD